MNPGFNLPSSTKCAKITPLKSHEYEFIRTCGSIYHQRAYKITGNFFSCFVNVLLYKVKHVLVGKYQNCDILYLYWVIV